MVNQKTRGPRAGQKGAAAIEFALTLPLLLLLLSASFSFGIAFKDYLKMLDAARIGARAAMSDFSSDEDRCRVAVERSKQALEAQGADRGDYLFRAERAKVKEKAVQISIQPRMKSWKFIFFNTLVNTPAQATYLIKVTSALDSPYLDCNEEQR
jgi:Flp pilus assembly protein TadG